MCKRCVDGMDVWDKRTHSCQLCWWRDTGTDFQSQGKIGKLSSVWRPDFLNDLVPPHHSCRGLRIVCCSFRKRLKQLEIPLNKTETKYILSYVTSWALLLKPGHTGRTERSHLAINAFEHKPGTALSAKPMVPLLTERNIHIILPINSPWEEETCRPQLFLVTPLKPFE